MSNDRKRAKAITKHFDKLARESQRLADKFHEIEKRRKEKERRDQELAALKRNTARDF